MAALIVWAIAAVIIVLDSSPTVVSGSISAAVGFSIAWALADAARRDALEHKHAAARLRKQLLAEQDESARLREHLEARGRAALSFELDHAWLDYQESIGGPDGIALAHACRDAMAEQFESLCADELRWEDRVRCLQLSYRYFIRTQIVRDADLAAVAMGALAAMQEYAGTEPVPYLLPHAEQQMAALRAVVDANTQTDVPSPTTTESPGT